MMVNLPIPPDGYDKQWMIRLVEAVKRAFLPVMSRVEAAPGILTFGINEKAPPPAPGVARPVYRIYVDDSNPGNLQVKAQLVTENTGTPFGSI